MTEPNEIHPGPWRPANHLDLDALAAVAQAAVLDPQLVHSAHPTMTDDQWAALIAFRHTFDPATVQALIAKARTAETAASDADLRDKVRHLAVQVKTFRIGGNLLIGQHLDRLTEDPTDHKVAI